MSYLCYNWGAKWRGMPLLTLNVGVGMINRQGALLATATSGAWVQRLADCDGNTV